MTDQMKNAIIGLFVICALALTIFIILYMEPSIGDGKKILHVRFSNISGLSDGTRVSLAGKPIGEVIKIRVIKKARDEKTDELGRVYFYELTLRVDSSVEFYSCDKIAISTIGLMGEKSIEIIPQAPKKGKTPKIITKQVIYADSVEPLEYAFHKISELSNSITSAVDNLNEWFTENHEELNKAVKTFGDAMEEIDIAIHSINEKEVIQSLKETIVTFNEDLQLIRSALEDAQDREMIAKLDTIFTNFAETSHAFKDNSGEILSNVNIISRDIAEGRGSIGKLIHSDDFYLRITAIMGKVDTLMNDVNNYGVLFQYNKHWKRIRTKRATLLTALQTPSQFRNYFEKEIDDINTSLGRISMLLEKAENAREKERIMESTPFKKDFASLLREVENLFDSLKLYNEQMIETISQ